MSSHSEVVFNNVSKLFKDSVAVDNISFTVKSGQLVTLLGPSGCGKTTTLRMIAGLELPSSGQIIIGDEDVSNVYAAGRSVGMVFQSYALFPHMTVLQNIGFGLSDKAKDKDQTKAKVHEALQMVGLNKLSKRYPSELSGGQQQRVAIARSIVTNPKVLLFDEPLSNLDAKLRRKVRDDIRALQEDLAVTSIYVTHDQEEALAISDEIIVMKDGVIEQKGAPTALYQYPQNAFVANFIGEANKVTGQLTANNTMANKAVVFTVNDEILFGYDKAIAVDKLDKPCEVFIRPNAFNILSEPSTADYCFVAEVVSSVYMGSFVEYVIKTQWQDELFMVDYSFNPPCQVGSKIHVSIDHRGTAVI